VHGCQRDTHRRLRGIAERDTYAHRSTRHLRSYLSCREWRVAARRRWLRYAHLARIAHAGSPADAARDPRHMPLGGECPVARARADLFTDRTSGRWRTWRDRVVVAGGR